MHWRRSGLRYVFFPDSPSVVEWPSMPALPTPPQQHNNSRFQGVLRSFRKVIHPLQRGPHNSASPREHHSFDLLQPTEQSVHHHRFKLV